MKAMLVWSISILAGFAEPNELLRTELEEAMKASGAPGMAAVVFNTEKILARADLGVRQVGKRGAIGSDDLWHIGSNGKAMTAMLVARLVAQKKLRWDSTMAGVFGPAAKKFHEQAQKITVLQLLSHTAGLPANPSQRLFLEGKKAEAKQIHKQRRKVMQAALTKVPLSKPGTKFLYSNTGYIVVGAVVEKVLGMTWEKAIQREVFEPLGMKSVGFGAPTGRKQPRGHSVDVEGKWESAEVGYAGDNPAIYGPAGGMHLTLADWVTFLQDQMLGHRGKGKLLKKEAYRKLHTPVRESYALGWTVVGDGVAFAHEGSNTLWYALVMINPHTGLGALAVANDAGEKTGPAMQRAMNDVIKKGEWK